MTDRESLLANVLANRDDDLPRLVLCDWLEETGNAADEVRAGFIRKQIATGEAAGFVCGHDSTGWFRGTHELGDRCEAVVRRGFVESVRGPLSAFWGEQECDAVGPHHGDRCDGGRVQCPNAQFTQDCRACRGEGRVAGPTPAFVELVAREPVERVEVSDKEPTFYEESVRPYSWCRHNPGQWRHTLPHAVWDRLVGDKPGGERTRQGNGWLANYDTDALARAALSDAMMAWARTKAV